MKPIEATEEEMNDSPERPTQINPFKTPTNEELFQFKNFTLRDLCEDLKHASKLSFKQGSLRRELKPEAIPSEWKKRDSTCPENSRRKHLPLTAREYLYSVQETAKNKHLSRLLKEEALRAEEQISKEEGAVLEYEQQLRLHQDALEAFLFDHYSQVSRALLRRDEVHQVHKDLDERLDYFSGLLKAAQTVQEEEKERLQELTAFQHFVAAVTPKQSLRDLMRRLRQHREGKASWSDGKKESDQEGDTDRTPNERNNSRGIQTKAEKEKTSLPEAISSVGYLESEVSSMRMVDTTPLHETSETVTAPVNSAIDPSASLSEEDSGRSFHKPTTSSTQAEEREEDELSRDTFDPHLFDPYLDDPSHLLKLSQLYENQCHSLLSLLTRLKQQKDSIEAETLARREKLQQKLAELERLQESSGNSEAESHLQETKALIEDWPHLAGDEEAKTQLAELGKQIGEVVRDIFGSSKFFTFENSESDEEGEVPTGPVGHSALLALLESNVTDLCSQLYLIPKEKRDPIFKKCEKERKLRTEQMLRQTEEELREERRKQHLERALQSPPPRPI